MAFMKVGKLGTTPAVNISRVTKEQASAEAGKCAPVPGKRSVNLVRPLKNEVDVFEASPGQKSAPHNGVGAPHRAPRG
jgi:hypothetical protein